MAEVMNVCDADLKEYRSVVDNLFRLKSTDRIPNNSLGHAAVITEMMFKYAPNNGNVYILCRDAAKGCYEDPKVVVAVQDAVKRGVTINFAHTKNIDEEHITDLYAVGDKVKFRHVYPLCNDEDKELNFSTNGYAVRVELDAASNSKATVFPRACDLANYVISLYNDLENVESESEK